jgi:hypothetical protein
MGTINRPCTQPSCSPQVHSINSQSPISNMVSTSTRNSSTTRKRARFVIIPRETLLASRRIHHEARYYLERNTLKDVSGVFKDFEVFMREGGILSDNPMVTSPKQWPLIVKKCSSFNVQIQAFICSARKWRTRLAHHDPMRYDFYERYINIRVELVFSSDILDIDDKGLVMNRDMVTLLPVGFNRETNKFWYSDANFERVDFLKRFMEFVRIARWMCESPAQRLLTKGYEHLKCPSLPHGHDVISIVAHEAKHINIDNGRWSKEDDIAVTGTLQDSYMTNYLLTAQKLVRLPTHSLPPPRAIIKKPFQRLRVLTKAAI